MVYSNLSCGRWEQTENQGMVLKMPEQLTGEKIPGHEALRRAARAITEAPLEGMTDEQKKELQTELQIQVRARRGTSSRRKYGSASSARSSGQAPCCLLTSTST